MHLSIIITFMSMRTSPANEFCYTIGTAVSSQLTLDQLSNNSLNIPQDPKDVEGTDQATTHLSSSGVQETGQHLSSSVEHLSLSTRQQWSTDKVRDQLKDCASYKGVAIELTGLMSLEGFFSPLESSFKYILLDRHIHSHDDLKPLITAVAQYKDYPETSPPFVIAVFVRGFVHPSVGTLDTDFGWVDIVDDIIKPFLPQSASHLMNIPKLFFISAVPRLHRDIGPPLYPDDHDSNYCVAYCESLSPSPYSWFRCIIENLLLGISVKEVVETSKPTCTADRHLHYFSCLKNKQLKLSK